MSRYIDADAVKNIIRSGVSTDTEADQEYVCERIDEAPSIEIIRCVECKWFNEKYGSCHAYHWDLNQGLEYAEVDADDFCSYGEREGE